MKYGINLPLSVLKGDPFYRDYCLLHELIHLGQILELHSRFAPAHYHELVTFLNEPSNVSPMEWLNAAIEEQILSRVNRT